VRIKKVFAALLFITITVCIYGFAQESDNQKNCFNEGISLSSIWRYDSVRTGGSVELGFPLNTGRWLLRDYITLNGYGGHTDSGTSFGEISAGNKFRIGGKYVCERGGEPLFIIMSYGFGGVEFGAAGIDGKGMFRSPFLADISGGGGFELQCMKKLSFFIEYGGGLFFPVGNDSSTYFDVFTAGYSLLSIGYRTYF
jgi:hypothetical protein